MKRFLIGIGKRIDALVAVTGISLITAGVGLYSARAAMITAGVLLLSDVYLSRLLKSKK